MNFGIVKNSPITLVNLHRLIYTLGLDRLYMLDLLILYELFFVRIKELFLCFRLVGFPQHVPSPVVLLNHGGLVIHLTDILGLARR